jgi:ribosomal protein S6
MGKYETCPETRAKIDELMQKNAAYQAANNCITNTKSQAKEINRYCNREFIRPIKDLDEQYYKSIQFQND